MGEGARARGGRVEGSSLVPAPPETRGWAGGSLVSGAGWPREPKSPLCGLAGGTGHTQVGGTSPPSAHSDKGRTVSRGSSARGRGSDTEA